MSDTYVIALGSNRPSRTAASPRRLIDRALARLQDEGIALIRRSATIETSAIGPSSRRYANAAAVIRTDYDPQGLLTLFKQVEQEFGDRRGQRWSARALDLDIILWSGGPWHSNRLTIPHPAFRERDFVLGPMVAIAGNWRDPVSGLSVRHLHARLTRPTRATR